MSQSPLESLIATGTKLWLDSIDPELVRTNHALGATGATSNPVIVADLIKTGRFDEQLASFSDGDHADIAWQMTDKLVKQAQDVFHDIWKDTRGNDGYVSFELDPLLEDPEANMPHGERVKQYIELGKKWSSGHDNRMIKVPATPAGIEALEELAAAGITLNVTLIFTMRQYHEARKRIWRGAQRRPSLDGFKSVYSIFVSRVDVYTAKHVPELSDDAQGQVGIINAKRIWQDNQAFWNDKNLPLQQEIVFASTGVKDPEEDPGKYVAAFAGSGIETNPPATNDAVQASGQTFSRQVDSLPADVILAEVDQKIDIGQLEKVLMREGIAKFADPQKALLQLVSEKRSQLT